MNGIAQLLGAIALIGLGGLFAAIDAAISTVSVARVEELMREERPGAVRLARVVAERPRYINLVVLLRIVCEVTATVLLVAYLDGWLGVGWGLTAAAAIMTRRQLRGDRCRAPNARPPARVFNFAHDSPSVAGDFGSADPDQPTAGVDR